MQRVAACGKIASRGKTMNTTNYFIATALFATACAFFGLAVVAYRLKALESQVADLRAEVGLK